MSPVTGRLCAEVDILISLTLANECISFQSGGKQGFGS
jgi:hypothetical protein